MSYQELLADDYNVMFNDKMLASFMSDFTDEDLDSMNKEEEAESKKVARISEMGGAFKPWTRQDHSQFLEAAQLYSVTEYNKIADYMRSRSPQQVELHARVYNNRKKQSILSASTEALVYTSNNNGNNTGLYPDYYGQNGNAFVANSGVSKYPVPSLSAAANEWSHEECVGFEEGLKKFPIDQFNAATRWIKIAASLPGGRKTAQDVARRYESLNLSEKKPSQGKAEDPKARGRKRSTSNASDTPPIKPRSTKRRGKDKDTPAESSPPLTSVSTPTTNNTPAASPPPIVVNNATNNPPPPSLSEIPADFFDRANKMLDDSLELINAIQPMDAAPNVVARNLDLMIRIRDSLMNIIQWTAVIPNSLGAFHSMPALPVRINDMLINYLVKQFPAPQLPPSALSPSVMVPLRPSPTSMPYTPPTPLTTPPGVGYSPSSSLLLSPNTAQTLFSPSAVLNLTPLAGPSPQGGMFPSPSSSLFVSPTSMLNLSPLVATTIDPHFLSAISSHPQPQAQSGPS